MNKRNQTLIVLTIVVAIFLGYKFLKKEIVSSDTLIIGTNVEYPPFAFMKNEEPTGFDIDVVKEVARRLNKKPIFKNMSFDALIPEVQLGHVSLIAAGMTPTPERAKRVIFTKPHFEGTPLAIVTLRGNPRYTTIESLKGKRVVVNQGYFSDTFMTPVQDIELLRVGGANISEGILALQSNRADAYVTSLASLKPLEESNKLEHYIITPIEGSDEKIALVISPKHAFLEHQVQEALDTMKTDGTLDALQTKWNLK